jgi:hypothetical protein
VLDESEDSRCHEPGSAHRRAPTGDLGDLHDAAPMGDLYPPTIAGGLDLVGPGGATGVDDDLGAIALPDLPSLTFTRVRRVRTERAGRLSAKGTPRLQPNDHPRRQSDVDPGTQSRPARTSHTTTHPSRSFPGHRLRRPLAPHRLITREGVAPPARPPRASPGHGARRGSQASVPARQRRRSPRWPPVPPATIPARTSRR